MKPTESELARWHEAYANDKRGEAFYRLVQMVYEVGYEDGYEEGYDDACKGGEDVVEP